MLALLPALPAQRAYLVPDLAGHGSRTSDALPARLDPDGLAADLIEACGLAARRDALVVIGHSLGALVALALQERLLTLGRGALGLVLGDPPLFPCGDTESQQLAKAGLLNDPLGRRLLDECFAGFDLPNPEASPFLASLRRCLPTAPVITLLGGRGRYQRPDGSQDCGTFISMEGRTLLAEAYASEAIHPASSLMLQAQLGHFVLHDQAVLALLAEQLASLPQGLSETSPIHECR
jgi:pimeloyl-ACP methyl ester carboxylesterase